MQSIDAAVQPNLTSRCFSLDIVIFTQLKRPKGRKRKRVSANTAILTVNACDQILFLLFSVSKLLHAG